jgi:hypothetical protein
VLLPKASCHHQLAYAAAAAAAAAATICAYCELPATAATLSWPCPRAGDTFTISHINIHYQYARASKALESANSNCKSDHTKMQLNHIMYSMYTPHQQPLLLNFEQTLLKVRSLL